MKKIVIGIMPTSSYLDNDDSFADTYRYPNNYVKKIIENGAEPYFIPLINNEIINDTLNKCDGLLIPGGNKIFKYTFPIIDYFYKNKKPILGICLGMQALAMYSVNLEKEEKILKKIDTNINHWPFDVNRINEKTLVHNIIINEKSYLYKLLNTKTIKVNSLHNYTITKVGSNLSVGALSEDSVIEEIEYIKDGYYILGTQFHPEVMDDMDIIFKDFINYCEKRQIDKKHKNQIKMPN